MRTPTPADLNAASNGGFTGNSNPGGPQAPYQETPPAAAPPPPGPGGSPAGTTVGGRPIIAGFDTDQGRTYMNDAGAYGNPTLADRQGINFGGSRGTSRDDPDAGSPRSPGHLPGSVPGRLAEGMAQLQQHAPEIFAGAQAVGQRVRQTADAFLDGFHNPGPTGPPTPRLLGPPTPRPMPHTQRGGRGIGGRGTNDDVLDK